MIPNVNLNNNGNVTTVVRLHKRVDNIATEFNHLSPNIGSNDSNTKTLSFDQISDNNDQTTSFEFDHIIDNGSQKDVFNSIQHIIDACKNGVNSGLFAYGPTGSGKSYTTVGPLEQFGQCNDNSGLATNICSDFLSYLSNNDGELSTSMIELYNNQVYDLLAPSDARGIILKIRETKVHSVSVPNLQQFPITSLQSFHKLLLQAVQCRRHSETSLNRCSSRSHFIITFYLHVSCDDSTTATLNHDQTYSDDTIPYEDDNSSLQCKRVLARTSKLCLVDLAGFESAGILDRVEASNSENDNHARIIPTRGETDQQKRKKRLTEGGFINQSLFALNNVIRSLQHSSNASKRIPYRDSKLTHLLQDFLGGNSVLAMICCLSQSCPKLLDSRNRSLFITEALQALEYTSTSKKIRNKAVIQEMQLVEPIQEDSGSMSWRDARKRSKIDEKQPLPSTVAPNSAVKVSSMRLKLDEWKKKRESGIEQPNNFKNTDKCAHSSANILASSVERSRKRKCEMDDGFDSCELHDRLLVSNPTTEGILNNASSTCRFLSVMSKPDIIQPRMKEVCDENDENLDNTIIDDDEISEMVPSKPVSQSDLNAKIKRVLTLEILSTINHGTIAELLELCLIGEKRAGRIVEERDRGKFGSLDELSRIGLSKKVIATLIERNLTFKVVN